MKKINLITKIDPLPEKLGPSLFMDKKTQGKKNKAAGARFELKVRKDLESNGWIVSKWMNNVETVPIIILDTDNIKDIKKFKKQYKKYKKDTIITNREVHTIPRLVPAKHKFRGPGIPMAIGTGFPDFVVWHKNLNLEVEKQIEGKHHNCVGIFGVEVKSNGYLNQEEKEKCRWLSENKIFIKILIASKGEKRGEIKYQEVKNNGKKDI